MIRPAVAADPAELRMSLRELARPSPAMVIFIDRGPSPDLEANLVAVLDRGGQTVELAVIDRVQLSRDVGGAFGSNRRKFLTGGEVGLILRLKEVVDFGFAAGLKEFAFVSGNSSVEHSPINV